MTRRELFSLFAAALASRRALAFGDSAKLVFAQLRHGGRYAPREHALRRLCWEIEERTSIETEPQAVFLSADDPELFYHPFLYLAGEGPFPALSEAQSRALRRFLVYGGFVLCDSADGGAGFDESIRREIGRALPDAPLARVPDGHVLYKSFYLLDHQGGRQIVKPYLEGAQVGSRLAVVYSQNDLGGAWARDDRGEWELDVVPGGEAQRETAFRLGVNLAMYATCLDYKDDQVHLPFILRRRQ
ncbi:MAG: DUF4159 domain-containing protein [Deltaproteobacteria bacterium]